ncbi:MAG: hypothetical protein H6861_07615 [Rhodospirillales bacterium]|nr:hypothetical protein [Rhodospirillales bacterium]
MDIEKRLNLQRFGAYGMIGAGFGLVMWGLTASFNTGHDDSRYLRSSENEATVLPTHARPELAEK